MIITKSEPFTKHQKQLVESLAMDLKRVSLGLNRGSDIMVERFKIEALKRTQDLENLDTNYYLNKLIQGIKKVLRSDNERVAEDALMYNTLFQNYTLQKMRSPNERR